jgi:hypothetical protein
MTTLFPYTTLCRSVFLDSAKLTSVTIANGVTTIGVGAFARTGISSLTIPNSVKTIEAWAFYECKNLKDVTIGSGVTGIADAAFGNCTALTSITFAGAVPAGALHNNAFTGIGDLRDKYLAGGAGTYTRPANGTTWTKK